MDLPTYRHFVRKKNVKKKEKGEVIDEFVIAFLFVLRSIVQLKNQSDSRYIPTGTEY